MTVKDESAVANEDVEMGVKVDEDVDTGVKVDESTPPSPTKTKTRPHKHPHSPRKRHSHLDPPGDRSERVLIAKAVSVPSIRLSSEKVPEETIVFAVQPTLPPLPAIKKKSIVGRKSSLLAVSDDPFAAREGKTLLWRDVNMTLVRRKH
jgi:hypothetical protein